MLEKFFQNQAFPPKTIDFSVHFVDQPLFFAFALGLYYLQIMFLAKF